MLLPGLAVKRTIALLLQFCISRTEGGKYVGEKAHKLQELIEVYRTNMLAKTSGVYQLLLAYHHQSLVG